MTTNKKLLICTLLILTMFSIVGAASASDLTHANSTISDTHSETISHDDSQSSATESHATQLKSSSDNKEKQTATNDEITSSSQIDEKEITTQRSEEKTRSSNDTEQSTNDKKLYKSSGDGDKLTGSEDPLIVDKNDNTKYTTISDAVSAANDGDTIFIKNGIYNNYKDWVEFDTAKNLRIVGEEKGKVIINRASGQYIFYVHTTGANLIFENLTFVGLDDLTTSNAAGLWIDGASNVKLINCTFSNIKAQTGAINAKSGSNYNITLKDCLIENIICQSGYEVVFIQSGNTNIDNLTINNCRPDTGQFHSLIRISGTANVNLTNSKINNINTSTSKGLIFNQGNSNIKNVIFENINTTCMIYNYYSVAKLNITQSTFTKNNISTLFYEHNKAISLNIEYCAIYNNIIQNKIFSGTNSTFNANKNYWGTNDKPSELDELITSWIIYDETENKYKLTSDGTTYTDLPEDITIPGLIEANNEPEPTILDIYYVSQEGNDANEGTEDAPVKTIKKAIEIAQAGKTIQIASGTYTDSDYEINKDLTITGKGDVILNANSEGRLFNIINGANVVLKDLQLINGCSDEGGAINVGQSSSLTVNNTLFKNNVATSKNGGAINTYGKLNVCNSTFIDNEANKGGAISTGYLTNYAYGEADITKSTFINNSGSGYLSGEIIYNMGETTINYSIFFFKIENYMSNIQIYNYNIDKTVNAKFNFWANGRAGDVVGGEYDDEEEEYAKVDASTWVIMNAEYDTEMHTDKTQNIIVDFKHYTDSYTDSTHKYDLDDSIPELNLTADTNKGNINPTKITTVKNEGKFVYTAPSEDGIAQLNFACGSQSIPIEINIIKPNNGIVYVSKDGDDSNEGFENSKVKTIQRAINIATSTGNGKIIISEGTYTGYNYNITKNLEIIGQGKVTIDAEGKGRLFFTGYPTDVSRIALTNLTLTGANDTKNTEIIVSSYANELVLNNVNITNNFGTKGLIKSKSVIINNSKISGHNGGIVIKIDGDGNSIINNTLFENNMVTDNSIVDIGGACKVNLTLENCQFINNRGNLGIVKTTNRNVNIIVKDSEFINNTNLNSDGGAISAYMINVTNSTFIGNKAKKTGGAIYASYNGETYITQSVFINNTANTANDLTSENYGDAICSAGKLTVNYSVLLTNKTQMPFLIYSTNYNYETNATFNYWGINTKPGDYIYGWDEDEGETVEIDVSNWILMTVTPTSENMNPSATQEIKVDFTHCNGISESLTTNIPELTISATAINGTINPTDIKTQNNIATFTYNAPNTAGEDIITFKTGPQTNTTKITINNIPEPTTGIVYVSTTGDNDNEGTEEKPVATIAKAIEIATSATGSKKIIILDGTYIANGIVIDSDLNITGRSAVTWDANTKQAFKINSGNVNITNIKFINGNESVYGHLFRVNGGELSVDNCEFINNGGTVSGGTEGIIYIKNAKLTITNSLFENNTAGRGNSFGIISVTDGELYVDNCNFTNNFNRNGAIYIKANSIGSSAIIKNSKFIGNNATSANWAEGGAIYISGSLAYKKSDGSIIPGATTIVSIDNCEFINNSAKGGTYIAQGGAIYSAGNSTLSISKSKFINNTVEYGTDRIGQGGAICVWGSNITITESLFENNFASEGSEIYMKFNKNVMDETSLQSLNVTKSTFNSTSTSKLIESNYTNGRLFAIGNTWVNTEDPSTRVSEGIIVKDGKLDPTITINVNNPTEGEKAIITVNTGAATGNVTITIEGKTPETINITNGIATLNTTELTAGTYNITITYNGDNNYNTKTENTTITIKSKTTPPGPTPTPTNVVSPETISNFFDENGVLKEDAPDNLVFSGDFNNLSLTINKPVNITGDNAVFNNTALNITADNVKVNNIEFVADETFDKVALISTTGKNTTIENNTMTITGNTKATGIFAENATIAINNNNITTASNNTMVLNNTNGTINNNTLKAGNNINGSASISQTGCNVTIDNGTSKPDAPVNPPENPQPQPQPSQPTTPPAKESDDSIPAKQIKITTPKTPKKISKRAKKLTIRVKLKVKGKLARGKKVVIIIKGKKYTRKTNKRGIAKLTLKKAKLRKILRKVKVGKKLKYKVKYGKKTIKRSLKVKK